ncbi:hypothetical protein VP01_988g6 [Puccinia sorghi]|uniref:Uncharacterized protein n=1 Tax=Puccinia sorghi TaxID=27349 RepID=A0A0L6U5H8_9BASI|nr:hypothetical protein VP01_988g6 [Puccinia sorghi]
MDLNLPRPGGANPIDNSFNSSISNSNSNTIQSNTNHQANPTGSNTPNLITNPPQNPIVQLPVFPGIPANADVSQNLVAPPLYPCSLATVIINFPSAPPPNPFPHPGFLTAATKYARSKDHTSTADLSTSESNINEQTDSNSSSADDPSSSSNTYPSNSASSLDKNSLLPQPSRAVVSPIKNRALTFSSTLSSLSNASRNGTHSSSPYSNSSQSNLNSLSSRPRAAFKGSTSTFIKSSEGLPLPQSLIKSFYASSSDSSSSSTSRDEGEERTFGFYTWNKSLTFVQLSPPRPSAETLVRLTFAAFPTHVSVNHHTASPASLDVVIGFSTGDLIYFDPFCARYTRLNKSGCISGSAVSKIVWLAPTITRRDGHFVSSHVDGTMICWDKEREDWNGFLVEPWPKSQTLQSTPHPQQPLSSMTKRNKRTAHTTASDPRGHDILISGLSHSLPSEKRNRLNPVYHWKVGRHISQLFWGITFRLLVFRWEWDLSRASLAKPRLQQINSSQGNHPHGASRRQSLVFNPSSPVVQHHYHRGGGHKNLKAEKGIDSSVTLAPSSKELADQTFGMEGKARDVHPAPGRNEVAILQPVMVKEIGLDPLSAVHYHRGLIVVASRTGQISVFGRPTPPSLPPHSLPNLHPSD